jgi:hypothetical protein
MSTINSLKSIKVKVEKIDDMLKSISKQSDSDDELLFKKALSELSSLKNDVAIALTTAHKEAEVHH